jgi:3-deoxy-manno-octulosonate cytidylyltransferase (CMP-KDO synthetase)
MIRERKVLGVIPARYNSSRLPGKPLADILGKPMIQWVYERSHSCKEIDELVVATDDERIYKAVTSFGGKAIMTEKNHRTGTDRVGEVAEKREDVDLVINIQGDEPLISKEAIAEAVSSLIEEGEAVVATLKRKIDKAEELLNPNIVKVVSDNSGYAIYFSRAPIPYPKEASFGKEKEWLSRRKEIFKNYFRHIGLYVFKREFLLTYSKLPKTPLELIEGLEQLRILEHGYKIKVALTSYTSYDVNTEEDLKQVREIMKKDETKG